MYQPIVDLETCETLAYEALARGPHGSILARPDLLVATTLETRRFAELDWTCRAAAVTGALQRGLRPPHKLFMERLRMPFRLDGERVVLGSATERAASLLDGPARKS